MGNDMTWEQKCRISALRAACASQLTIHAVAIDGDPSSYQEDIDDMMTKRILARAETFRVALLSDGALDYTPDADEASQGKSTIEGTVANCTRCLRAIRWLKPPGSEGRWIDAEGISQCHNNDRSYGDHTIEIVREVCPRCGSSRKKHYKTVQLTDREGWEVCSYDEWHQE